MYKTIKIGKLEVECVFRHYWEKDESGLTRMEFGTRRIGIWWRRDLVLSNRKKGREFFSESNTVPMYMFGIDLAYVNFFTKIVIR